MAVQDKIIAGILLVHSTIGILWTFWVASQVEFAAMFLVTNLVLAAIGLAAGVGWLKQRRWAAYWGPLFFLVQLVHVLLRPSNGRSPWGSISTLHLAGSVRASLASICSHLSCWYG